MPMNRPYAFRAPFPPCEFSVWEDLGRESVGGGGGGIKAGGIRPTAQRLPIVFCVVVILLLSVESYVALYAIVGTLARFVSMF
jgi:hypothetical protein